MSKNACRIVGLLTYLVSVFFLIGGLYLRDVGFPVYVAPLCLIIGLVMLIIGAMFYHVLKSE